MRWRTVGVGHLLTDEDLCDMRLEAEFDLEQRSWNSRLVPI